MLAREIELEKLRQYESNLGPVTTPTVTIEEIEEPKVIKPPPNAAMTLALKPKPIAESCKVSPIIFTNICISGIRQTIFSESHR